MKEKIMNLSKWMDLNESISGTDLVFFFFVLLNICCRLFETVIGKTKLITIYLNWYGILKKALVLNSKS